MKGKLKLITFLTAMVMAVVGICGCLTGCNAGGIESQRREGKRKLDAYAAKKIASDYSAESWSALSDTVEKGKTEIESASSKQEINRIVCDVKLKIDGTVPQKTDERENGVYILADDSWESYVRNYAEASEMDEAWVQKSIKTGGEEVKERFFWPRQYFSAVIIGEQITVEAPQLSVSYLIGEKNGHYTGKIAQREIEFYSLGNEIYIIYPEGDITHFQRDYSYDSTEESLVKQKLEAPHDVEYGVGKERLNFQWDYRTELGSLGAVAEIKRAGEEEYKAYKHELVYMNMLVIDPEISRFSEGDNYLRIYSCGGTQRRNDKKVVLYENSDYITFLVHIGDEITIEVV